MKNSLPCAGFQLAFSGICLTIEQQARVVYERVVNECEVCELPGSWSHVFKHLKVNVLNYVNE